MGFKVTTCPGCACGCGVLLEEVGGILTAAHPISAHPISKGSLCIRGWNCADSWRHPERLTRALVREGEGLRSASTDEALDRICTRLKKAPPGSICFTVAPSVSNEDILAITRLAQSLRARVCGMDFSGVPTARRALTKVLGRHYCANSLSVLESAQIIWIFGADLQNYPQVASAVTAAEVNGAKVVSFDTFCEPVKKNGRQVVVPPEELQLLPPLLQKCALKRAQILPNVASRPGFDELAAFCRDRSWLPAKTTLQEEEIRQLVASFLECSDSAVVIGERWLTTGPRTLEQTVQLLQAIALLGAEERIVIAAGEANSWGLADLLEPRQLDSRILNELFKGRSADVSVLVTCGDDLLRSAPCPGNLEEALQSIGAVIVLDRFRNDLWPFADAVLPTACFAEWDGSVTNTFGMVQRLRQAVPVPGDARPDRAWLGLMASRLGLDSWPESPLEWWMTEQALDSPYDVSGLCSLHRPDGSSGWLLREETNLTLSLPSGPFTSRDPEDRSVQAIFTRHPANWMTGAWSQRDEILRRESVEQALTVAPPDLEERGIKSGARVRLVTHEGSAVFPARADSRLPRGLVSLAEIPGRRDIPRPLLADFQEGFSFQPVPCRLEKV